MEKDIDLIQMITKDYISLIFGYSLRRTNSREDAEDLAQDILIELIASIERLKKPKAYNGFIWAVANNTYKRWLRKKNKNKTVYIEDQLGEVNYICNETERLEENIIDKEELYSLRWELSILSKTHRDIVISYYIEEKSCSEIARELDLSVDNVKYYLYKARNIMKDGINMNREFGERCYKPAAFVINYWGDFSVNYINLSKRKLPGNILLTALAKPVSISDISIETGVPAAYIEDEIMLLEEEGLIQCLKGEKYQTAIIVINERLENDIKLIFERVVGDISNRIYTEMLKIEKEVKKLFSIDENTSSNNFLWSMLPIVLSVAVVDSLHPDCLEVLPQLKKGNHGWLWGSEINDRPWEWSVVIKAITKNAGSGGKYAVLIDFKNLDTDNKNKIGKDEITLISKAYENGIILSTLEDNELEVAARMIENRYAINDNGIFKFLGAMFSYDQGEEVKYILSEVFALYEKCLKQVRDEVLKLMKQQLPQSLYSQAEPIANVKTISGMMSAVMEDMVNTKKISIPSKTEMYPIGCYIRL